MNFPDLGNMFGQLKGMQEKFLHLQNDVKKLKFTAETGGGMVKATVDGQGTLQDLHIDTSLLEPDEMSVLSDLIITAVQGAQRHSKEGAAEKMKELSGGLSDIPGISQFFR